MVAELSSPRVLLGIAGGTALIVMLFVVLAGRARVPLPVVGLAFVAGAALIATTVWVGLSGTPTTQLLSGGSPGGSLPPPHTVSGPPPTAPPPTGQPSGPACQPTGTTVEVTALGIAFDTDCLAAPADQAFTLTFDNEDPSVPHNVDILSADPAFDPSAQTLFATDLITGPVTQSFDAPAIPAGTYFFRCDVHPQQMFGTFVVVAG
jgi:hypothetical protein